MLLSSPLLLLLLLVPPLSGQGCQLLQGDPWGTCGGMFNLFIQFRVEGNYLNPTP